MKKLFVPVFVSALLLTGCGGGSQSDAVSTTKAAESASPQASMPTATPTWEDVTVAQLKGKNLQEAGRISTLMFEVYAADDETEMDWGTLERSDWEVKRQVPAAGMTVPGDSNVAVYVKPIKGTKTWHLKNSRWSFECSDAREVRKTFYSLKDVWNSRNFKKFEHCEASPVNKTDFKPTAVEKKAIKFADYGDDTTAASALAFPMEMCVLPDRGDEEEKYPYSAYLPRLLRAALVLCPEAKHADQMSAWLTGEMIRDGRYVVGTKIPAGAYQLQVDGGISDCYWERSTAAGDIIDNNFITFASEGPVVQVFAGEGFTSERCGVWKKVW